MTEKQEARLIKKSNRIRQKIIEIELTIKENKLKGLDYLFSPATLTHIVNILGSVSISYM
jgi:hypothetical protein